MDYVQCPCGEEHTHLMGFRQHGHEGPSMDLAFDCECCGERFVLRFRQNKGLTEVSVLAWFDLHEAELGGFQPAVGYPYPEIPPLITPEFGENAARRSGGGR